MSPINNSTEVGCRSVKLRLSFVIASLSHPPLLFTGSGLYPDKNLVSFFPFVNNGRGQPEIARADGH